MIKIKPILTLTLATAFFISDLPPIIDPEGNTLHGGAALEVKQVSLPNIESKNAETPETMSVENRSSIPAFTTSCEAVELCGDSYKNTKIQCIKHLIKKQDLNENQLKSYSPEVNVFLPGSRGGDNSEAKILASKQLENGIYQSVVGPIYPGWTNTEFGKTSTWIWNYREIKDLYAELFLKLKEKHGKIQIIGFSYGGFLAILGYLSLKKEDREGIRVLVGDPGAIAKCIKELHPWAYWPVKILATISPRYDGGWFDVFTFPLTLFGRFIVWMLRKIDPSSPSFDEHIQMTFLGKQLDEMLAKEEDASLDIQITGCGKKVSDMSYEELLPEDDPDNEQLSAEDKEAVRSIMEPMCRAMSKDGFYTEDVYRRAYKEIAKKTKYPAPLKVFNCAHSDQMRDPEFWRLLKDRMEAEGRSE